MFKITSGIALVASLLTSVTVAAAPLNISESPDFPAVGQNIGTLDVGTNVINGSWSATPVTPPDLNTDNFMVTLPNGLQIDSISVAFALENGEVVNMGVTAPGNVFLASNPGTVTGPFTALGDYLVELSGGTMFNTTNWTVTFNVTQPRGGNDVPEPMTPALMGVALAGLLLARRRKQ